MSFDALLRGTSRVGPALPGSLNHNRRLGQWVRVRSEGWIEICPGKVELGQGIATALLQIAAEELDVRPDRVRLVPPNTLDSPDEGVTSGSLSVQDSGTALRHACAEVRAIYLQLLAQRTGVPLESLRVEDGAFFGPSGELASYWAMADDLLLDVEATAAIAPKRPGTRAIVGRSLLRIDLPGKVFGQPAYVHDLRWPGMLHARVVRPPSRAARLASLDAPALHDSATLVRDGSFLAVAAPSEKAAELAAIRVRRAARWAERESLPEQASLARWLRAAPAEPQIVVEKGEPPGKDELGGSVRESFFRPFLAHASVAPCCAVAMWNGDRVEVWSHTQGIYNLRRDLALTLRLHPERVVVRHVEGAGCYGHNGADDVALDAALVARAHPGRHVRVLWSRADELGWGPLSPAMLVDIEARLDRDGLIASWATTVTSNGHSSRPGRSTTPTLLAAGHLAEPFPVPVAIDPPLAAGGGAQRNAIPGYSVRHLDVRMNRVLDMPIRSSALRGLGALVNVWAIESVIESLAEEAGADPLVFRLAHLEDTRARYVLREVAEMAGWDARGSLPSGQGLGIAWARYKGTGAWCAVAALVAAERTIAVQRLWIAADVGEVVNPDGVINQIEGGAMQAVSIALKEEVTFDRMRVTSDSWERYPILRFSEVPRIETRIVERPDKAALGAGEASMGPTIAAIAGAIRQALGVRVCRMPFTPENIFLET